MKRKTNLFYTDTNNTNFITFSNYTESLTGNFLSTDTKLYPSAFICMNIPKLTYEGSINDRIDFIQNYIAAHYENKMAVLRDYCITSDTNIEDTLYPLEYLIETIMKYDAESEITFVGNITEQNYNGIYSDSICVISAENTSLGSLTQASSQETHYVSCDETTYLYGWTDNLGYYTGPSSYDENSKGYNEVTPVFDNITYYNTKYKYDKIELTNNTDNSIKFNVLIPLFNVTNINTEVEVAITPVDDTNTPISLIENANTLYIPFGMWFSDPSSPVILERDRNTQSMPSWSLVLSSQFKPFPYSHKMPTEIESSVIADTYNTFAQVLVQQNSIIDAINNLTTELHKISNRIYNVENNISNVGTTVNIDTLKNEFNSFKKDIENQIKNISTSHINQNGSLIWQKG